MIEVGIVTSGKTQTDTVCTRWLNFFTSAVSDNVYVVTMFFMSNGILS